MLGMTFSSELYWGSNIISIAKTVSKKIAALICWDYFSWGLYTLPWVDIHVSWLNWFHCLILEGGLFVILIDCIIFLSPFLDVTRMSMSIVSFLAQLDSGILQPLKCRSKCFSKFHAEVNAELLKLPRLCCGNCFADTFGKFCLDSHSNFLSNLSISLGISFFFFKEKTIILNCSINLCVIYHCMHKL